MDYPSDDPHILEFDRVDAPSSVDYKCLRCGRTMQIIWLRHEEEMHTRLERWHLTRFRDQCSGPLVRMCLERVRMTCAHVPGACHRAAEDGVHADR